MKKRFSFNGKKIVMVAAAASLALGAPLHASTTTTIDKLTGYTAMGKINRQTRGSAHKCAASFFSPHKTKEQPRKPTNAHTTLFRKMSK